MSRSAALTRARSLREALLDHGVPKVSIEIQQGRPGTPHGRWYDDRFVGSMGHHIVSRRSQGLTPGLSLIKRGRSDVPGPLCNGYGGFDQVARIICMGWANHPGAGGPYTLPSGRIPASNGRPYLFGWEHEGGLNLTDWTDEFRSFMGSCHAGTLDWLGLKETSHIEHKTWTKRKIDRLGYTLNSARAEIRDNWDNQEDDMPAPKDWDNDDIEALRRILFGDDRYLRYSMISEDYNLGFHLRDTRAWAIKNGGRLAKVLANQKAIMQSQGVEVDEQALAAEIAAVLVPAVIASLPDTGLTDEQVEEAAERAISDVLRRGVDA